MMLVSVNFSKILQLLLSYLVSSVILSVSGAKFNDVTCGSVIKLLQLNYKVRLHSHEVKYGSGSGQQSVTGVEAMDDVNSHWVIKALLGKQCPRGEAITCGQKIRLEHLTTKRNLHSHLFSSPLSGTQEVSAFGEEGKGDTGDNWEVICEGDTWKRDKKVMLKHIDTNMYLSASGHTFGRPIHGQMEICAVSQPDTTTYWEANEGIFVKPVEISSQHHEHTEL